MNTQVIGEKIRRARFARGKLWTQKMLAEKAGLSQGYISAIERGEEFPSLKALTKISEVLEWPLSYFIESEAEADGSYFPESDSTSFVASPTAGHPAKEVQLKQAVQTLIRIGLDGQGVPAVEETTRELRARIDQLESRIRRLESALGTRLPHDQDEVTVERTA